VELNQTQPNHIVVSGWSKAKDVDGQANGDYSVYVDLTYMDGSNLWGQISAFETGDHDWQQRHLVIVPSKPVRSINVYAIFRNHTGTVWFDDFDAREVDSAGTFDGQDIDVPVLPAGKAQGSWFLRDVATGKAVKLLDTTHSAGGVKLVKTGKSANGKTIEASLRNTGSTPRCITAYYVERFEGKNPIWWDDIRTKRPAASDFEYGNLQSSMVGANGNISLYPFGCVTAENKGLALGVPPSQQPRVTRIAYNGRTKLFFVAFDIALAPQGDLAGHDAVTLAVTRYAVDPSWGFRDAAAKFYGLFPESYQRRAKKEGIWMPFTDPAKITNAEDFQFAYHEGDNSVVTDRKSGVQSFRYVEPMSYWMPMPKTEKRTYDNALAMLKTEAAKPVKDPTNTNYQGDLVRQSQAVLNSGTQDAQGRYNITFRNEPWCDGALFVLNPNPRLPHAPDQWTKARLNNLGKPIPGKADQPDGQFLDSIEMSANVLDYNPLSLRYAGETATFTPDNLAPVIPTWFSVYESTAALSKNLHSRGKLLFANSTPWGFTAFGPLLDVMGTETDMFSDGKFVGESDDRFNLRRTLCYHKPYLLLLNTDYTKLDAAKIALYFQRCMFYAVFPSMFSVNAADHPYWEDPKLYNRDRAAFKKYLPVISALSAAGWEPVTHARSNQDTVWLERYGRKYLSVMNSTSEASSTSIVLDQTWGKTPVVKDMMTGEVFKANAISGAASVKLDLKAGEVRVLEFFQAK